MDELEIDFFGQNSRVDGDFLTHLKFIEVDEVDEAQLLKLPKTQTRKEVNTVKPLLVVLLTDSTNVISSSDTLCGPGRNEVTAESDCDELFDFDIPSSAFSYYDTKTNSQGKSSVFDSSDTAASTVLLEADYSMAEIDFLTVYNNKDSVSVNGSKPSRIRPKQYHAPKKYFSCPDAARISLSGSAPSTDWEDGFDDRPKARSVTRSLEEAEFRKHRQQFCSDLDQYNTGTTTLESLNIDYDDGDGDEADDEDHQQSFDSDISSTSAASSIDFTDERAAEYIDDCSRTSSVSLYCASPVNLVTDTTAASLNIISGFMIPTNSASGTGGSKKIRSQQNRCKTCTLDGLKFHPSCPFSSARPAPITVLTGGSTGTNVCGSTDTNTWAYSSELLVDTGLHIVGKVHSNKIFCE